MRFSFIYFQIHIIIVNDLRPFEKSAKGVATVDKMPLIYILFLINILKFT